MSAKNNAVYIATPLKDDSLVLRQATYTERLGEPFLLHADMVSLDEHLEFSKLMGKNVTLRFETEKGTRYINGLVTGLKQLENIKTLGRYEASIRPWFWLLTLSQHCRIFQQKTYPDIVKSVFESLGFADFKNKLRAKYDKQDYVVQFNETDFDFVSRIFQQEGIFYAFEHTNGKHTLVLYDDVSNLNSIGNVEYHDLDNEANLFDVEGVFTWENNQQMRTSGVSLSCYDFTAPSKQLYASAKDAKSQTFTQLHHYEYGLLYNKRSTGEHYAKLLMEQHNASYEVKHFSGNMRTMGAGERFLLCEHPREDQNKDYLTIAYQCTVNTGELSEDLNESKPETYVCSGQAIPANVPYRLKKTISKPKMHGPQTATVMGKSTQKNDQIWTDQFGRVKVKFHWDTASTDNESSSCWIRVAQSMSGKKWGSMSIPRVGQEVLVDFLQGDPDQPVIIGCIYNGASMPPYPLPKMGHLLGFRSNTTKANSVNEIRFDDTENEEQLYISAAKNQDILVTQDCFETIGSDKHLSVKNNHFEQIKHNRSEDIGASHTVKVGKDASTHIIGKDAKLVENTRSLSVKGNCGEDYGRNLSINIEKDGYIKADNICLEADNNITLKVGNTFIAMEREGIAIHSTGKVSISAKQSLQLEGEASTELKSKKTASIKGKTVKIN
jgi:type VI secretion system secreted protein VgrG